MRTLQMRSYAIGLMTTAAVMLLAFCVSSGKAQSSDGLSIGDQMPMATYPMKGAGSSQVSLNGVSGKAGTLVVFWGNSCPWVDRYEDRLISLAREYEKQGIGVVAVNANDPEAYPDEGFEQMQARADQADYPFPYVVDSGSQLARAFGASRTPEAFLFDKSGSLVYTGTIDDNPRNAAGVEKTYLRNALDAVVSGSEISDDRTKVFGCTIKWQQG